jgi:hypothetical protein
MKKIITLTIACLLLFVVFTITSCKDEKEKVAPVPEITVTVAGHTSENVEVNITETTINIRIPMFDAQWQPVDLTNLKISFSVKYGTLRNYDNDSYHDFSVPVIILVTDYLSKPFQYTVTVETYIPQVPDFTIQGIQIEGIALAAESVTLSGSTLTAQVPTLKDDFSATDFRNLPVRYIIEYGTTSGFTNGEARDYSNPDGVDIHFMDYGGTDIVYKVKIEAAFVDKGPKIDPVRSYTPINLNWQEVVTHSLPAGVELYTVNDFKPGSTTDKTSGYYAKLDLSGASQCQLGVGYTTGAVQNIKRWYTTAADPKPAIITNAGFFGGTTSYSLIVDNSQLKFSNIATISRDLNGTSTPYSVTRSAFGIMPDGSVEVTWVYNSGGKTYAFDVPVRNAIGYGPLPHPMDNAYSSIRKEWTPALAIGGAPVLVKDNLIVCTETAEFCDQFEGNRSRTAIGVTEDNKVILLVLDETPSPVKGWSMADLAMIMKTIGCKHAINLDGGGSTAMVVKGTIVNNPSDKASEGDSRAVPTVVLIKQK